MEAICSYDYQLREALVEHLNDEPRMNLVEKRKTDVFKLHKGGIVKFKDYLDEQKARRKNRFNDETSIVFSGELVAVVSTFAMEVFGLPLRETIHAYIDKLPSQIGDGIHDIKVYEEDCNLYSWSNVRNVSGLIVLKKSKKDNFAANYLLHKELEPMSTEVH